jgi:histidinol-phosphate aminotransferase
MTDLNKLVRDNILRLKPYSCARDEFQGSEGIFLDANENPYGNLNRYPDPYQRELKRKISELKGIPEENIFLGNGSDEIIDLTFRTFCNPGKDKALTFPPTYGMYEVSADINDVKLFRIKLDDEFRIDLHAVKNHLTDPLLKLIFICSPNNPTGNAMEAEDVQFIIQNFRGIVVIDEAYSDFSDKQSLSSLINKYDNLIVMQTFSKALGMAAARIGMAFCSREIVKLFNKVKPPYNISTINQKAALQKFENLSSYRKQIMLIKDERDRLRKELGKLTITDKIYPSDANFLLVKTSIDATEIYNKLISRSIVVRNRSSIIEGCLRITVGKKSENNELLKALKSL